MTNKEIVLEYLKSKYNLSAPMLSFTAFAWSHFGAELPKNVEEAYQGLTVVEDAEILIEFGEFVISQAKQSEKV